MFAFFCVLLSYVIRGLAMGRPPVEGILTKCVEGFIVSGARIAQWYSARLRVG
jgi:hypothetical protein